MITTPETELPQSTLDRLHPLLLEILIELDRLCQKHGLTYFLISGTLLGAVRHKGFVPWDDDMDVAMPRESFNRFLRLCQTELDERFYMDCVQTNPDYPLSIAKLKRRNTVFKAGPTANAQGMLDGIWVDIFPLDNAARQHSPLQSLQTKSAAVLGAIRAAKGGAWSHKRFSARTKILWFFLRRVSNRRLAKWQIAIQSADKNDRHGYWVNHSIEYPRQKRTQPKSVYLPAGKLEFEGKFFCVPHDSAAYLRCVYGEDYLIPSPPGKRHTHSPLRLNLDTAGPDEALGLPDNP